MGEIYEPLQVLRAQLSAYGEPWWANVETYLRDQYGLPDELFAVPAAVWVEPDDQVLSEPLPL